MTQRFPIVEPSSATGQAKELFDQISAKIGRIPNIMKTMANAPAALKGYVALNGALAEGRLPAELREQIALAIGEANRCDYCLSAHTAIGKMVGLDEDDVAAARQKKADDPKVEAALDFVHKMVISRGNISEREIAIVRNAGYNDEEIIEMIGHVALNTFTNYFNVAAQTTVDFPKVAPAGTT